MGAGQATRVHLCKDRLAHCIPSNFPITNNKNIKVGEIELMKRQKQKYCCLKISLDLIESLDRWVNEVMER